MKVTKFDDKEQWLVGRLGKVSGTRLKDIAVASSITKGVIAESLTEKGVEFDPKLKKEDLEALLTKEDKRSLIVNSMLGADRKKGFYELIAERLAIQPDDENAMARGNRLEPDAIARFTKETKIEVETNLCILSRDDNDSIALSPDGYIKPAGKSKKIKEMVESKSLNSASHIEAYLTKEIPSEYHHQKLQYFIVNDDCQKLYWIFYDPRFPVGLDFFYLEIDRKDVQDEVDTFLEYEKELLKVVDETVLSLI